jgi:hypothetical protein
MVLFVLKNDVSETGFHLHFKVEPTQMGTIERYILFPYNAHNYDSYAKKLLL